MSANSDSDTSWVRVYKAPTRRDADPPGPSRRRISPDTDVAFRIPSLEDLSAPTAILGQV
jgi:hypothetical protein